MLKSKGRSFTVVAVIFLSVACGTNPVTHKREIQFISESQEVDIEESMRKINGDRLS